MHIILKFVSHAKIFYFPLNLSTIDGYLCAIVHAKLKLYIKLGIESLFCWDRFESRKRTWRKMKQNHLKVSNQSKTDWDWSSFAENTKLVLRLQVLRQSIQCNVNFEFTCVSTCLPHIYPSSAVFACKLMASICKLFLSFGCTCFNVHLFTFPVVQSSVCLSYVSSLAFPPLCLHFLNLSPISVQTYFLSLSISCFELICWDRQKALFTLFSSSIAIN